MTAERELVLSVSIHDCEVQTFRAGGPGGQKQNKTSSGVRVIHHPSGARGESREQRSQQQNKRQAFLRMVERPEFRYWLDVQTRTRKPAAQLEREISDELERGDTVRVEYREAGKWVEVR